MWSGVSLHRRLVGNSPTHIFRSIWVGAAAAPYFLWTHYLLVDAVVAATKGHVRLHNLMPCRWYNIEVLHHFILVTFSVSVVRDGF